MEKRYKIIVRWAVRGLALLGALIVIGVVVFVARLDYFGRIAADRILANASHPDGYEMPFTSGAIGYSSADIQIVGGMGQGLSCSLPSIVDRLAFPTKDDISPIGLRMRQACAYHDYCYRHGAATYGLTQADCDFALQAQAFRLCRFIEREKKRDAFGYVAEGDCMRDARLVTLGVRVGGSDSFRTLDTRSTLANGEPPRYGTARNNSTFFEFDPYATLATEYKVYRIADAPPEAGLPGGTKAIYRFRIRPSGTIVSVSVGLKKFEDYAIIRGHPNFQTSAPFAMRAGAGDQAADWFVWWQRVGDDQTTGRLFAWSPHVEPAAAAHRCQTVQSTTGSPASGSCVAINIGRDRATDPELQQLRPADLGKSAARGLSLVSLRSRECRTTTRTACYVHVLVKTDGASPPWQPQEPLIIDDRFSPRTAGSKESERYRNFSALPFVLDTPDEEAPVIAWTRRNTSDYRDNASLRRAAVNHGADRQDTRDDTSRSLGTVFLSNFGENDEPAFMLGSSSQNPILATLVQSRDETVSLREWTLPPSFDEFADTKEKRVDVKIRCDPGLEAVWLQRPPQILGRPDGTSLAIFSRLTPDISKDWTFAKVQIATLVIRSDGTCSSRAVRGKEIALLTTRSADASDATESINRGRNALIRVSRSPLMLIDANGDGSIDAVLPQGSRQDVPEMLCSFSPDGDCR